MILKTQEEVDSFINVTLEWRENTPFYTNYLSLGQIFLDMNKVTRVIAFITDKGKFYVIESV